MTADQDERELSPLDMARNLVRMIDRLARFVDSGPEAEIQAHINGYGARQANAATMAAQLALCSIAEDVHRLVGVMLDGDVPPRFQEPGQPEGRM
jgi:hypothetical protein